MAQPVFPHQNLGGYGDGGACFTNDPELADLIRRVSRHGQAKRYFHTDIGVNGRMDTLQAAILLGKWPNFAKEVQSRGRIGAFYSRKLQALVLAHTSASARKYKRVCSIYCSGDNRTEVQAALKKCGIPTAVHYPTLLCQQPALRCKQSRCSTGCYTFGASGKSASNKSAYASMVTMTISEW